MLITGIILLSFLISSWVIYTTKPEDFTETGQLVVLGIWMVTFILTLAISLQGFADLLIGWTS